MIFKYLTKIKVYFGQRTDAIARNGADTQTVNLPSNGIYSIVIKVKSIINNGVPDTTRAGMARGNVVIPSTVTEDDSLTQSTLIKFSTQNQTGQTIVIPQWIKNNAKWWQQGQIDDSSICIRNSIYHKTRSNSTSTNLIKSTKFWCHHTSWVKTNAGLWADGQIDDQTFASGIQYLIKIGIISV